MKPRLKKLYYGAKLSLFQLFVWGCVTTLSAQTPSNFEKGIPPLTNYSPKEYDADTQNWASLQNDQGIMYFGNGVGLLEFDGVNWKTYQVPNKTTIRALAKGDNGEIFVGAQGDLGYFIPDEKGKLTFHSLRQYLPEENKIFSDVWQVMILNHRIYFNTSDDIFIWDLDLKEFKIIHPENSIHLSFDVNEKIYVREWGKGLMVLENDSLVLLKGSEQFANERIYVMLPFPDKRNEVLLVTRTMGLYKYDGETFTPFKTEIDDFIKENLIYLRGTLLNDGNFLLGTLNGGAVVIDKNGKEIQRYNIDKGIISNKIYFTQQDKTGAIWLSTENGISRVDYASPINYFNAGVNLIAAVNDITRYQGVIFTAANDGIYYLDPEKSYFKKMPTVVSQAFVFLEFEDMLLTGTYLGVFQVNKTNLTPVRKSIGNEYGASALTRSVSNPNRVFVGTSEGIWSLLYEKGKWVDEGQILDITDQFNSLFESENGELWAATSASGIFRITFQKDHNGRIILQNPVIENFTDANGIQNGGTYISKLNNRFYFTTTDSIYEFDPVQKSFYPDMSNPIISGYYSLAGKNIYSAPIQDSHGRIWTSKRDLVAVAIPENGNNYNWVTTPFNRIANESVSKIYVEKNGVVWFAIGDGVIKYDMEIKIPDTPYPALIRSVETGSDSVFFFGEKVENMDVPVLKHRMNSLKFRYAATSYESKNSNKYQTFLEGFDKHWSVWTPETFKEYTNLPPGKYTFNVKAVNILGSESSIDSFSFRILPPWYRTWWSFLLFFTLFAGILRAYILYRGRRLTAEKKVLERKVSERTQALEASLETVRSTQSQLIQSEKMASLGELTAGIAHEIQNPLNFVNNFSEVNYELIEEMQEEIENGNLEEIKAIAQDLKENEKKINHHGKRAESIVKGMLLHSRGSTGQKEPTDINALCDEYLRLSYHGFRAKDKSFNADFKLDADEKLPKIDVVPQDIGRVLLNLMNNAFYAVAKQAKESMNGYLPSVVVSTQKLNDKIEIRVHDNGPGIPDEIKDKIFQPFFTTKPTGQGTGLGLSLSYDIVTKSHAGTLSLDSTEGKGTTFIIQLPNT